MTSAKPRAKRPKIQQLRDRKTKTTYSNWGEKLNLFGRPKKLSCVNFRIVLTRKNLHLPAPSRVRRVLRRMLPVQLVQVLVGWYFLANTGGEERSTV